MIRLALALTIHREPVPVAHSFFIFLKSHTSSSGAFYAWILCLKVKCIIGMPGQEYFYLCQYGVKKNMPSWLAPHDPAMICSIKWWRASTTLSSYRMINLFILREEGHQGLQKKIVVGQWFSLWNCTMTILWSHSELIKTYHANAIMW